MATGPRWRSSSPAATAMTSPSSCRCWTPSRPSAAGRASSAQAGLALRGPRLRPRHLPRPSPSPRHRPRHRTPKHPPRHRTRRLPLGGRADLCLAPRLPTTPRSLGTSSRHSRSLPQTGLLPHHPPANQVTVRAAARRLTTSSGVKLQPTRRGPLQLIPITSPSRAASGST